MDLFYTPVCTAWCLTRFCLCEKRMSHLKCKNCFVQCMRAQENAFSKSGFEWAILHLGSWEFLCLSEKENTTYLSQPKAFMLGMSGWSSMWHLSCFIVSKQKLQTWHLNNAGNWTELSSAFPPMDLPATKWKHVRFNAYTCFREPKTFIVFAFSFWMTWIWHISSVSSSEESFYLL